MRRSLPCASTLLASLLLSGLIACENKEDSKPNVIPGGDIKVSVDSLADVPNDATSLADSLTSGDAVDAVDAAVAVTPCGCPQVGQLFRFTELKLLTLDGGLHPVIGTLNNMWKTDIGHFELNFYFEIAEVNDAHVKFRVVNGARTDDKGNTCLLDAKSSLDTTVFMDHPRQGCHLMPSTNAGINVYAGTPTNTKNCAPTLPIKHAIPVRGAALEANVAPDCSALTDGMVLSGNFAKDALAKICTCITLGEQNADTCGVLDPKFKGNKCDACNDKYQSLTDLLEAFGDLQYGCKAEDGGLAVCLTASFQAVRVLTPPPSCK